MSGSSQHTNWYPFLLSVWKYWQPFGLDFPVPAENIKIYQTNNKPKIVVDFVSDGQWYSVY